MGHTSIKTVFVIYLKFDFIGHPVIFSGNPAGEISLEGGGHFWCQSLKKWVLIQEKGLGNWAFVRTLLLLVLLSWVYRSLASLVIGEVVSGSLMWSRN